METAQDLCDQLQTAIAERNAEFVLVDTVTQYYRERGGEPRLLKQSTVLLEKTNLIDALTIRWLDAISARN